MSFSASERHTLLITPQLGPRIISRLEEVGLDSVDKLRAVGIDEAVRRVCDRVGSPAWRNRQRPLARALADVVAGAAA
ncbi:MAG: hypothetical protein KGN16_03935 [Burkholderiales bacterium]|nr:hypothetical protein [Burkholderiales bacterium]